MMRSIVLTVATLLVAGTASAELLHNGKPRKTVADRIIEREQLVCTYGQWESYTQADGSTIIQRTKVCPRGEK